MNDRRDFVLAVIVALTVPLIIGGLYFYQMTRERGSNGYIAKLESDRELIVFGDSSIESVSRSVLIDSDYARGNVLEFNVVYASGINENTTYVLKITHVGGIRESELKNISWRLVAFDEVSNEYKSISVGNFDATNGDIELIQPSEIALGDEQHYKLYYYLNKEIKDNNLYARISVE